MQLILSATWLGLVFWLIQRAWRQRNAFEELAPPVAGSGATQRVAVIIPARNESSNIRPCIESLLAQRYPIDELCILVVDDNSTDETAAIVGEQMALNPRLNLRHAPPLPCRWQGKAHACSIGAGSVPADTRWLCFIDADMRASPELIASAVDCAVRDGIDLLSLTPRHELLGFAERLIIPCGLYLLGFSQDLKQIQKPDCADVVATGQFMLVSREAYQRVGGHAAVGGEICEDLELARLFKRSGYRVLLKGGTQYLAGRMYTGWRTLWLGITKNLSVMLGGPTQTVMTALIVLAMAWSAVILPLADAIACGKGTPYACTALVLASVGSAALWALHLAGAVHFGIPFWYGMLFPAGYTVGAVIALDSTRRRLAGHVHWKGRVYQ
jgi:chlorobactene glucosyltransferase